MTGQSSFEWLPEYDGLLEQIASTDIIDAEWTRLQEVIKYKLDKNIALYLSQSNELPKALAVPFAPRPLPSGGLKLPPFPAKTPKDRRIDPPKIILTAEEANELKESIYSQLDDFEGAPFTIQRLCELCLHPRKHYKFLGKYLRAVEKTLLVTSTWDSFPLPTAGESNRSTNAAISMGITPLLSSAPPTPMFSPIPFLHDDARRSQSRSPPPSPLMLASADAGSAVTVMPQSSGDGVETKALGLVDELDDPSPGHLSDHPHPLSATTTVGSKPFLGSLEERFVRSALGGGEASGRERGSQEPDDMAVDDPEKENKAA